MVKQLIKASLSKVGLDLKRVRTAASERNRMKEQDRSRELLAEDRKQLAVDRKQLAEDRKQLSIGRKQFAEDRKQLSIDRKQFAEDRKQPAKDKGRLQLAGWRKANLRKPEFSPKTVFDVGAANGTPVLYKAFPEAFHVLIEPLEENEPHLQKILREYEGKYFLTAVGARDEELTINVEPNKRRSSIYSRTSLSPTDPVEKRKIPVTTLDALAKEHHFQPPFGLKIDTEGFEYQVLEGAPNFLRETQFVIAELSIEKLYEDSYSFAEFVGLMDRHNFYLCDVLHMQYDLQSPSKLLYMDVVFKK